MTFWTLKKNIYPLISFTSIIFIIVYGLITAKSYACTYFLIGLYFWFFFFGYWKQCLRVLPGFLVVGGIFFAIFYFTSDSIDSAVFMVNRLAAVFVAVIPGMRTDPVAMTRALSQVHTPRAVTLGMLIALSFMPMLRAEIQRVHEAMKTRGAGSLWNPKIFYRALLIPLVMRLVNISDTLALSVETRGFTLSKAPYTIYKKESVNITDIIYTTGIITGAVLAVVL